MRNEHEYKVLFEALLDAHKKRIMIPAIASRPDPLLSALNARSSNSIVPSLLVRFPVAPPSFTRKSVALKEQLIQDTTKIFRDAWQTRDGEVVPAAKNLGLGNNAVTLDATVMYADMRSSTAMVDGLSATQAAEIYKEYLSCAARIIKAEGGAITAYDGDRIMAVFIGGKKNTSAARAALQINWAVVNVINPRLRKQYGDDVYQMGHVIGIDRSKVTVSRIGVRNDHDLVWVGRAPNYAAKLSAIDGARNVWITDAVFNGMLDVSKYSEENPRRVMWDQHTWNEMNGMQIYASNCSWPL